MLFVIGMLAALLIWLTVAAVVLWLLYKFFKWSLTFLWRALTWRVRVREAQLRRREQILRIQEKIFQARAQQLEKYMDQEWQEWYEKNVLHLP